MSNARNLADLLEADGDVKSGALDNAFDGAYSSLTGTPTTLSGYGITDAATAASPTFTGDATFDTSVLTIDSTNDRVGIGTSSPSVEFEIASSAPQMRITDTDTNAVFQINASSTTGGVDLQADATGVGSNPVMAFDVGGTERMRIDSSGDVGIGESSPARKLHVKDATGTVAAFENTSSTSLYLNLRNSGNANGFIGYEGSDLTFWVDNNRKFEMEVDGDFHADGDIVAYSTTVSDERLKTNIQGIENAVAKVSQLNGYTFEYKADGKISAGVIAQEVEKVLPEAVSEKQLPLKTDDDQEYKVVNYDALHGLLIEAIKELTARVEELEAK